MDALGLLHRPTFRKSDFHPALEAGAGETYRSGEAEEPLAEVSIGAVMLLIVGVAG